MLSRVFVRLLALLGAGPLLVTPALGDTVYDNGPTNHESGYTLSLSYTVADDFTLGGATVLTGVKLLTILDPLTQVESIDWQILTNASGGLGSPVAGGNAAVAPSELVSTGELWGYNQIPEYGLRFTLPDVTLSAGTYWLALHANTSGAGNLYWETAHGNATPRGYQYDGASYFRSDVAQFTFSLDGHPATSGVTTPLPGTATAGLVLLGGVGLRRRRRSDPAPRGTR